MRNRILEEIFGNIDDDLIIAADIDKMPAKRKPEKWGIAIAACFVAVCAAAAIPIIRQPKTPVTVKPNMEEPNKAGGIDGKINLSEEIILTGTDNYVSNEEGYAYLNRLNSAIQSELTAVGVQTEHFRITTTGYAHVRTGDKGNQMAVNWRDYIAYNGDEIIAIVSVTKDEQGFRHYLAWGSPGFSDYGKFLSEHKGESLVFLWVGDVDAVITPDNQIFCLCDINDAVVDEEINRYYSFFKKEENTYTP